jgi:hypothetical protein
MTENENTTEPVAETPPEQVVQGQYGSTSPVDYRGAALLEDAKASRPPDDPALVEARAFLTPARTRAMDSLSEFQALCGEVAPLFDSAKALVEQASAVGVPCRGLSNHIAEASKLVDGGVNSFKSLVTEIDSLTPYVVYQGWHRQIPGRVELARANISALRDLASKLPIQEREVRERLGDKSYPREHVPTPGLIPPLIENRRTQVATDHSFDPRNKPAA